MLEIHADGSSSGKKYCTPKEVDGGLTWVGPGGWAFIIVRHNPFKLTRNILLCDWGWEEETTNNIMEVTAAYKGLVAAERFREPLERVVLVSDSQVCLGLASGKFSPTKNKEISTQLEHALAQVRGTTRWVKGHSIKKSNQEEVVAAARAGDTASWDRLMNFRCDQLAHMGKMRARELIYSEKR
ncbi:MAG: hypothetical protein M0000_07295 [Actinomycetota bacterium]|nr:hypothetical protein [Actinomycetota bacterium]